MERHRRDLVRTLLSEKKLGTVTLWRFPEQDFDEWISLGMGEAESYAEYLVRLDDAASQIEADDARVVYCEASPREVLDWLREHSLENTAKNRSYAFMVLAKRTEE